MEILVIVLLIAGLLIGWVFLMRVEILTFLGRILNAADEKPAQGNSAVRVVSVRNVAQPVAVMEGKGRIARQNAETEGGIPKWTLEE